MSLHDHPVRACGPATPPPRGGETLFLFTKNYSPPDTGGVARRTGVVRTETCRFMTTPSEPAARPPLLPEEGKPSFSSRKIIPLLTQEGWPEGPGWSLRKHVAS